MNFLNNMLGILLSYVPKIVGALVVLLIAWLVATLVKKLVNNLLLKTNLDEQLSKGTEPHDPKVGRERVRSIGKVVYLLVFVLFLPSILDSLDMTAVSAPISNMMSELFGFIPNLVGAGIVLFIGYFIAKVIRDLTQSFLSAVNIDKFYDKINPDAKEDVSDENQNMLADVLSKVVFGIILIPIVIVALEMLSISTLTEPIVVILNQILIMIPNVFVAIFLLVIGFYIAKLVGQILESLLEKSGVNGVFKWADEKTGSAIPRFDISKTVSGIVKFLIMLFMTVEALGVLKLEVLNTIGYAVIGYIPLVLSGILIIGAGIFGGYFIEGLIKRYTASSFAAVTAKYAMIVFAVFMTLDQINFASRIVNIAFVFIIGGLSVAFALSFGLGGKDFAKRQLAKIEVKTEEDDKLVK